MEAFQASYNTTLRRISVLNKGLPKARYESELRIANIAKSGAQAYLALPKVDVKTTDHPHSTISARRGVQS